MTAPDSRDSDMTLAFMAEVCKAAVGAMQMNGLANRTERLQQVADRLQALARGPQQAGGEDYARLWRNRWVSDRTAYWQPTAGNYESARIRAEAEAADYEQTFDAARERGGKGES